MIMQGFLIILVLQFFFVAATFADELVLAQVVSVVCDLGLTIIL